MQYLEDFLRTASINVLQMQQVHPDLVIVLAHGGILPARATAAAWTILTGKPFPPLLLTNIGREKIARYRQHCQRQGRERFVGTHSSADEVVHFLDWLARQRDWLDELRGQIDETLGAAASPQSIVVIDEMQAEGNTMLLVLGLLEILYPQAMTFFLDGPYFEWRSNLAELWLATYHPGVLAQIEERQANQEYEASHALYVIASGTEDIAEERICFQPLSAQNPALTHLLPYLPLDAWLSMPDWITETVLAYVSAEAAGVVLSDLKREYVYRLEATGNGVGPFLLLRHIRRWGSITVGEASQVLGIGEDTARVLLDRLAARISAESRWTGQPSIAQARISQGRVYFDQFQGGEPVPEPPIRRSKQQKRKAAVQRRRDRNRR